MIQIRKALAIISVLSSIFIFWGCEEPIDIELNDDENIRLVVEGTFTDQPMAQEVRLSQTASYFYNQPTPMVSDAQVTITSEGESYILTEVDSLPGVYRTEPDVRGTIGKTYTLNITTSEGDDYSAVATLNTIAALESITYDKRTDPFGDGDYYTLYCYAQDPPGRGNYYFFNVFKDGLLDNDTITEAAFSDDSYFDGIYLNGISIYSFSEKEIIKCVVNDSTESNMADAGIPNSIISELSALVGDTIFTGSELEEMMQDNLTSSEFEDYGEEIIEQTRTELPSDMKVDMLSISRGYYDFCYAILLETDYSGSLFSGPPANVPTNISNGALGYWECSAVTSYEFVLQP